MLRTLANAVPSRQFEDLRAHYVTETAPTRLSALDRWLEGKQWTGGNKISYAGVCVCACVRACMH